MKNRKLVPALLSVLLAIFVSSHIYAIPPLDQTGNLIQNGNFESGNISPWKTFQEPIVSISTEHKVDGQYSVFIDVPGAAGLYQYDYRTAYTFTASAWVYPIQGKAQIGIAWNSGTGFVFSAPTTTLNNWLYLELIKTDLPGHSVGGPLLYSFDDGMGGDIISKFYVDGVWFNEGSVNLSPYAPQNGFPDPRAITVTAPNGGEVFFAGETVEITWTSGGDIDNVKIEYSVDDGIGWTEIVASTGNNGFYIWDVPCDLSDESLVAISDVDGDAYDESDEVFSIEDQDFDGDGFAACNDCNDFDYSINPDACDIKKDGIDQDCDGFDRTKGKPCDEEPPSKEGPAKTCDDGIDNDDDGYTDCDDSDCAKKKNCRI